MSRGSGVLIAIAAGLAVWASPATRAAAPRFYVDDPIAVDPERQDAAGVTPRHLRREADYVEVALSLGPRQDMRALNVNTIDEVPDSSWYTNGGRGRPSAPDPSRAAGPSSTPITMAARSP